MSLTPKQREALELVRATPVTMTVAKTRRAWSGTTFDGDVVDYPVDAGFGIRTVRALEKRYLVRLVEDENDTTYETTYTVIITGAGRVALGDWFGDEEDALREINAALWADLHPAAEER